MNLKKLLVAFNSRNPRDAAIDVATDLARQYAASITLIDVVPDTAWPLQYLTGGWEETIEAISGSKQAAVTALTESLQQQGITANSVLAAGRLSVAIIREVLAGGHDLVVKAVEASGVHRSGWLGSTDVRLLRKCPCPILILRPDKEPGFQQVAAALDVMDSHDIQQQLDERVLRAAEQFCQGHLHLLYAMPSIPEIIQVGEEDTDLVSSAQLAQWGRELTAAAEQKLAARCASLGRREVHTHVLPERPAEAIPEFVNAHGIDLLVMGSVARSGIDGLLIGNTAERVLDTIRCSVLALKPESFVSPITLTDQPAC